jgi:hypothetical protein
MKEDDVVALLPLLLVLGLAVAIAVGVAGLRRTPPSRETAVAAARRHAALTGATAVVAAVAAGLAAAISGIDLFPGEASLGRTLMLAPVAAGIAHTAVLLLGELTWPRPQGDVRRARLARRGLLDAAPRWLVRVGAGAVAGLVVVLVAGALTADRSGRRLTVALSEWQSTASPFPGLFYGGPAAVGVAVLAVATLIALRVVAERPAVATEDPRIEAALRRASVHRVLRGATAATLALTAGLQYAAGTALHSVGSVGGPGTTFYSGAAVVLLVVALAGGVLAVVVACVPAPRVPVDDAVPTA